MISLAELVALDPITRLLSDPQLAKKYASIHVGLRSKVGSTRAEAWKAFAQLMTEATGRNISVRDVKLWARETAFDPEQSLPSSATS